MENAQVNACSLHEFVRRYLGLHRGLENEEDREEFVKVAEFALCGFYQVQHSISALTDTFSPETNTPTILRDYDSLLGFAETIPIHREIYLYTVFNPILTLTENIHLTVPFKVNPDMPLVQFRPNAIPNVAVATFMGGSRGVIRVMFPALFKEGCNSQIPPDIKKGIYEDGILPALASVTPEDVQNWPATFKDALFRAKNKSGTFQYGTRPLSQWDVENFSLRLRDFLIQKHDWARDLVYMIQVKGVKEANRHNPDNFDAQNALDEFLDGIDTNDGHWFVDVGLEISEPGKAYQWRADSHAAILREVLRVDQQTANATTLITNRRYSRDLSSHILDLAGCRVDLSGRSRGPKEVEYVQLYTTDKAVVYHLEKGWHSKFMTGSEALQGHPPRFVQELYDTFYNGRNAIDCAARIELRVPVASAVEVLVGFSEAVRSRSLVVYPRKIWWSWKAIRVQAIGYALALQNQAPTKNRLSIPAIELTIGLTWLIAGVYSRPDDGQVGREIMLRVLPITDDYNVGNLLFYPPQNRPEDIPVPYCQYGAVFLSRLKWPPEVLAPRLTYRDGVALHDRCYQAFFKSTFRELYFKHLGRGMNNAPGPQIRMRKGTTRPNRNDNPDPLPSFEQLAITFPEPGVDVGDDLPLEEVVFPRPEEAPAMTATKLWLRFLTDILQKCGNEKRSRPYCRLTMEERENVTVEMFQDVDLSKVFYKVQWRRPAQADLVRAFGIFWPDKNHVLPPSAQNFRQMRYYVEWKEHCSDMSAVEVTTLRRVLFDEFCRLNWVPVPLQDRAWSYIADTSYRRFPLGLRSTDTAPRIYILNDAHPTWGLEQNPENVQPPHDIHNPANQGLQGQYQPRRMENYIDLREEEEEDSDEVQN